MRFSRVRVLAGLLLWGVLAAVVLPALISPEGAAHEPAKKLLRFVAESPLEVAVVLPPGTDLRRGDPVFVEDREKFLIQVGRVESAEPAPAGLDVRLAVYPEYSDLATDDAGWRAFTVEKTAAWIAGILVPPERIAEIRELGAEFFRREGSALVDLLWPHVRAGLNDMLTLYEKELPAALAAQSGEWEAVLARHRDGVVREKLVPALRDVTLVIAKKRFGPLLERVGAKLWKALPVASLGWKAVWERVPFTEGGQLKGRFEKYLEEDAEPILLAHSDEAASIAVVVLKESLKDPRVKEAIGAVVTEFFTDPEVGALLKRLLNDLVIENERLHDLMRNRWNSGLKDAVVEAAGRFEPLIKQISDRIVLTADRSRINPRLTRVLRTRVMRKDCRWVMLLPGGGSPPAPGESDTGSQADD